LTICSILFSHVVMKANEIRAELIRRDIKVAHIAKDLGIARPSVSQVIHGKTATKRIQEHIAGLIGQPVAAVFPVEKNKKSPAP